MSCLPWSWALPWAMLLFLLGFQLLVTQSWRSQEQEDGDEQVLSAYLPATVEFAVHTFNLQSEDNAAYRLERVLSAWREKDYSKLVFSMNLLLHQTRCGKFQEDIDNCPFHKSPELDKFFICFFTVDAVPWETQFKLLNRTCSEGFP
ncbi:cystatin-9-like [Cynocephalus volans]|uniref:cystatin-9-like n=1 Tax=Cynocephalus volans TaxID=110931 RepID=UPI002FC92E02